MAPTTPSDMQAGLENVRELFVQWRRTRKKRGSIPDPLWEAAASLYPACSLYQISRELRLNHTKLKNFVNRASPELPMVAADHFIQVGVAQPVSQRIIDMRHQNGSRMSIQGADHHDLIKLARLFWSRP